MSIQELSTLVRALQCKHEAALQMAKTSHAVATHKLEMKLRECVAKSHVLDVLAYTQARIASTNHADPLPGCLLSHFFDPFLLPQPISVWTTLTLATMHRRCYRGTQLGFEARV
jgi:hypothetical protein